MGTLQYSLVRPAVAQSDLATIAPYMFWLMFRNIASDGFVFEDPVNTGVLSQPGCVLASPSWENTATDVDQEHSTRPMDRKHCQRHDPGNVLRGFAGLRQRP
jgi:hypothetical protein